MIHSILFLTTSAQVVSLVRLSCKRGGDVHGVVRVAWGVGSVVDGEDALAESEVLAAAQRVAQADALLDEALGEMRVGGAEELAQLFGGSGDAGTRAEPALAYAPCLAWSPQEVAVPRSANDSANWLQLVQVSAHGPA